MNRNVESHFSQLPSANIPRSRFDRSQDVKFTFNVGDIIPFYVDEVLPGDTFDITTSKVVRLQTLLTPVMDNMYLDTYFFFVPNRLLWLHWKNFMGESDRAWTPSVEYTVPKITFKDVVDTGDAAVQVGDILDYLGVPVGVSAPSDSDGNLFVNALPYRAYQKIYDDWFRDENLVDPININTGDADVQYYGMGRKKPYKAAKFHDYFTSGLPSPAKVDNPVSAPVKNADYTKTVYNPWVYTSPEFHAPVGYSLFGTVGSYVNNRFISSGDVRNVSDDGAITAFLPGAASIPQSSGFEPTNLYTQVVNGSLGVFITDLRYAVAVQQFYETLGRGGSRYIEIIASMFGVQSPDQRLQRSEYLGGNRIPISIHQITNQSQGENAFLGDLGAMSLTTDKHSDFVKSFVEHGFVLGLCVARYDHSYPQGLEKFWFRQSRFSYYWPVFANLSEQAILKGELYWSADKNDSGEYVANETFAYQERYGDYRYKPNRVAAEMRPGVANTLDSWHFADFYTEAPTLSKEWIYEDKTNVDRTLAVTSAVSNQLFADIYVQNFSTRPMPMFSIPGLYRM